MSIDITKYVSENDIDFLPVCPLCDNPIELCERHELVFAHGVKFIVHEDCLQALSY